MSSRGQVMLDGFRLIGTRLKEQMSLMEATEVVVKRKEKVLIGGEKPPEALPDVEKVTRIEGEVEAELPPPITTGTKPLDEAEAQRVIDQYGKPLPEEPITNMNFERAEYPEDIPSLLDELQRVEDARGVMQGRTTFSQIAKDAREESWEGIQKAYKDKTPLNTAQLRKLRNIDQAMWKDFDTKAQQFIEKRDKGLLTEQDEFNFRRDMAKAGIISNYLMGEKRRLGQNLAALRDVPDNVHMSKLQREEYLDIMNREMPFDELLDSIVHSRTSAEFKKIALGDKWYRKMARVGGNFWFNSVLSMWAPLKAAIGGAVIKAGDVVIDGSLRARLEGLAIALKK